MGRDDTTGYLPMDLAPFPEAYVDDQFFNVDTGATTYIIRDKSCITRPDLHRKQRIAVRTGSGTQASRRVCVGPATFYVLNEEDRAVEITRTVVYAPDFGVNLFSPTAE